MRLLLVFISFGLVFYGCSGRSESGVGSKGGVTSSDRGGAEADSPKIQVWVQSDRNPPYGFGVSGGEKRGDDLWLVLLEEVVSPEAEAVRSVLMLKGKPARFDINQGLAQDRRFSSPKAILSLRDHLDEGMQRVFVVFAEAPEGGSVRGIGEFLVDLSRLEEGEWSVEAGRVFNLPVLGSLEGIRLSVSLNGSRLTVNVASPGGGASQPVILLYDIGSESELLDPVDILMVPSE